MDGPGDVSGKVERSCDMLLAAWCCFGVVEPPCVQELINLPLVYPLASHGKPGGVKIPISLFLGRCFSLVMVGPEKWGAAVGRFLSLGTSLSEELAVTRKMEVAKRSGGHSKC